MPWAFHPGHRFQKLPLLPRRQKSAGQVLHKGYPRLVGASYLELQAVNDVFHERYYSKAGYRDAKILL